MSLQMQGDPDSFLPPASLPLPPCIPPPPALSPFFNCEGLTPVACQRVLHILYLSGPLPGTPVGDTVKVFYVGE